MKSKETPFSYAKHIYSVDVIYEEDYFNNKETPLVHTYEVASSSERNLDYIQKLYTNCKVLSIEKIK
jgi:hypothetical protein